MHQSVFNAVRPNTVFQPFCSAGTPQTVEHKRWADIGGEMGGADGFANPDLQATRAWPMPQARFAASGHSIAGADQQGHMTMEAAGWVLG